MLRSPQEDTEGRGGRDLSMQDEDMFDQGDDLESRHPIQSRSEYERRVSMLLALCEAISLENLDKTYEDYLQNHLQITPQDLKNLHDVLMETAGDVAKIVFGTFTPQTPEPCVTMQSKYVAICEIFQFLQDFTLCGNTGPVRADKAKCLTILKKVKLDKVVDLDSIFTDFNVLWGEGFKYSKALEALCEAEESGVIAARDNDVSDSDSSD